MELQFLTPDQLELTLKLADIMSMADLTVTAAILASYDWNIERAISDMQIGPVQENYINPPPPPPTPVPIQQQHGQQIDPHPYRYDEEDNQNAYEYEDEYEYTGKFLDEKRRMFEEEYTSLLPLQKTLSEPNKELNALQFHKLLAKDSRAHREEYMTALMNKSQSVCKNILEIRPQNKKKYDENKQKVENNRKFINHLYTHYKPRINFTFGTFFLNLTRAYLEGKFLLVYLHNIAPQSETKFKKLVELIFQQKQIAQFVNQNCITYGMFDNSDDYEIIQKYVPLKDLPAFALFKLDKTKRSQEFISVYKIPAQGEIFLEWLASHIGIILKKKQSVQNQKEKEIKEQIKQQEEKKKKEEEKLQAKIKKEQSYYDHSYIMAQQDQLYAELEKTYMNKRQISYDRKEKVKQDQEDLAKRRAEVEKQIEPQNGESIIEIRFRMPISGESKTRRFLFTDKISKMFTYVDCFCRDEFQQRFNGFDLRQSFPPLNLSDYTDKTIQQIFEGSKRENIIVREH